MEQFLREHFDGVVKLNDAEFEEIRPFFRIKRLRKRQYLIQTDQPVSHVYLVKEGLLKSSVLDVNGKEHIIQFAYEGWWISDFMALPENKNSTLSIDCLEDSVLLEVSFEDVAAICARHHKMEYFFRSKAYYGYVFVQRRLISLLNKQAKERYEEFVSRYSKIINRLPKHLIASYLGVSRETLSRLYKRV